MTTTAHDMLAESPTDLRLFGPPTPSRFDPRTVIEAMLESGKGISDLVFSPGRAPQVERHGDLVEVPVPGIDVLSPDDTAHMARHVMEGNRESLRALDEDGASDFSFSLPGRTRFRVNVFRQRGTYAIVMRVIAPRVPTFAELHLPDSLTEVARLKTGIVLVTGPTGSGKSSTLAAVIDLINETRAEHIITIEDPIEFIHPHKRATIHQRQLHTDTPSFALALRAALRQAPKVILVGEMRDRETVEIALTAAETGHLVLSTLHTIDASKTVERIIGTFPASDQQVIRTRLAGAFRYFVAQRLVPKIAGGRVAVLEILKSTMRTRDYVEQGEREGKTLLDAINDGSLDGMQSFDGEFERLVRDGVISIETGLLNATNPDNLTVRLADFLADAASAEAADADAAAIPPQFEITR